MCGKSASLVSVLVWFACYTEIMTSDKFVYHNDNGSFVHIPPIVSNDLKNLYINTPLKSRFF